MFEFKIEFENTCNCKPNRQSELFHKLLGSIVAQSVECKASSPEVIGHSGQTFHNVFGNVGASAPYCLGVLKSP